MHFSAAYISVIAAITLLASAAPLEARQSASVKTGYYNIVNGVGTLLTLFPDGNVYSNGTATNPQTQVWAITEIAGNYLILNNRTGGSLQGYTCKFSAP